MLSSTLIKSYFPPNLKFVDKWFTWTIFEALEPQKAKTYYNKIMDSKTEVKGKTNAVAV